MTRRWPDRKTQKEIGAARNRAERLELSCSQQNECERYQNDDGADEGGEVGIEVLDADFRKDRGQRRE